MTNQKLYSEVQMVPIDSINPSSFENPNEFSEELYESFKKDVERNGLIGNPLIIDQRNFSVLDGNHRLACLRDLGYSEIPCVFYSPVDDIEAKIISISLNQKRGTFNEERLHTLIKSIYDSGLYSLEELKDKLGFNISELKEKLETIRIDEDLIRKINKEAEESEKNMPVPINFVLTKEQLSVVSEAMEYCDSKTKADKITSIARSYLYSKLDDDKPTR